MAVASQSRAIDLTSQVFRTGQNRPEGPSPARRLRNSAACRGSATWCRRFLRGFERQTPSRPAAMSQPPGR